MDAVGEPLKQQIQLHASCPACQDFYREPVLLSCGSSYCRACVAQLSPAVCLECRAAFEPDRVTPNHNLARLVELARALLEQEKRRQAEPSGAAGESGGCGGGGEAACKVTFFCKQDKAVICPCSYVSEDHRGHDVVPADSATEEYFSHARKCLTDLKREEKDILMNKTTLEVDFVNSMTQVTEAWGKITAEFQEMEDFLERQRRQLLAEVTEVYKEIKMNKNEQLSALLKKLSLLQNIRHEVEKATKLPGTEFLENIGEILQTSEERKMVQPRGSLSFEIQRKISGLVDFHMFLLSSMKQFRENVTSGLNQYRGITTPDPNGSDPSVITEEPQDT